MTDTTEYVHVGRHADILASGRHVGPGDHVRESALADEDRHLIDEQRLVPVSSFDEAPSNQSQIDKPSSSRRGAKPAGGDE